MPATYLDPIADRPHPLLSTDQISDFSRNFSRDEKARGTALRADPGASCLLVHPAAFGRFRNGGRPRTESFEPDAQRGRSAGPGRGIIDLAARPDGRRVPQVVQVTVGDQVIPFLRAKTICGRLGATIIDGLTGGNLKLPRTTVGGTASWLPETSSCSELS